MKKMQRLVSTLLVLCLVAAMIPVTASATTSGTCGDNLTWILSNDGVLTISGKGAMKDNNADGFHDPAPWAAYNSQIKTIVIKNGVTSIGDYAFSSCKKLTSITIPNSVTSIGKHAFVFCEKLAAITIPDSVISIGDSAFSYCDSLTNVTIGSGVTSIGKQVFMYSNALTKITVSKKNTSYSSDSYGVLFNKNKTELIQAPHAYQGHYSIPNTVTAIGDYAFYWCDSLTSLSIPNSVTSIGDYAFCYCESLANVTIGNNLKSIGNCAFSACSDLASVSIPSSVTSIGDYAFESCCALTDVTIPASVTSIGVGPFAYCDKLSKISVNKKNPSYSSDSSGVLFNKDKTELIQAPGAIQGHYSIPDTVISVNKNAFESCDRMTEVTISSSVTSIGDEAFTACSRLSGIYVDENNTCYSNDSHGVLFSKDQTRLLAVPGGYEGHYSIPETVTFIGYHAFRSCNKLTTVTIPDGVAFICDHAFYCCEALTSVNLPDSVTYIGNDAFSFCKALTQVSISSNITYIGHCAFAYCDALTEIFFREDAPSIGNSAFSDVTATAYYPANNSTWTSDMLESYGGSITWVAQGGKIEAPKISVSNVAASGKIRLSWKKVEGAREYQVFRATSKNGTYKKMKTVTGTSYTNSTAVAGKLYYYYVVAVGNDGKTSDKSNIVSRTCDLAQTKVTLSNVASSGKVKISWEPVEGATKYQIYRATSKNGTYSRISTTGNTSATNTKTDAGKTYYYKVRAICDVDAAAGAYSEVKSITCDLPQPTVSIALSSKKPKVSWKKVEGATKYEVYRATSKSGTYSKVKTTTSLNWKDTAAKSGKTYYYKVVAVASKTAANSAYSSVVSIKSK